ncbi:MAG: hypothetical protein GWP05_09040 [Anaerolineaceae bacterium]|nr:hypothetical protein [Anaerolineaceae bacterium]
MKVRHICLLALSMFALPAISAVRAGDKGESGSKPAARAGPATAAIGAVQLRALNTSRIMLFRRIFGSRCSTRVRR